ncbi:MAG: hypothetical protein LBQ48_03455 [Oscillospiraceae bacterium]|jgi:hypothetical protein|nr:hypothetical protein [Oscillospiraceae bacterium]
MKTKIIKTILSTLLITSIIGMFTVTASARMTYIAICNYGATFEPQTGIITIDADIYGYEHLTNYCTIQINLQYYNTATSRWVTLDTVYEGFDNWYGGSEEEWYITPGYSYRGNIYLTGYYYSLSETIIVNTNTITY